jgi:transposase
MISVRPGLRILVTTSPVDFRRGMDSLAMLVTDTLRGDPFCGDFFVFRSKRSDRVKILAWDGTGLVLYSKRLETSRFIWPAIQDGMITLSAAQLSVLLDGLDWKKVAPRVVDRPLRAG